MMIYKKQFKKKLESIEPLDSWSNLKFFLFVR